MNFIMIDGAGDPDGENRNSIEILYALAFTIKMSKRAVNSRRQYEYVSLLEGLWWVSEEPFPLKSTAAGCGRP